MMADTSQQVDVGMQSVHLLTRQEDYIIPASLAD